jgi:hypothetical protein
LDVYLRNIVDYSEEKMNAHITIEKIEGRVLEFKIQFPEPEIISLGSQNERDELVIRFSKDLELKDTEGLPLVFDFGYQNPTLKTVDFSIPI